MSLKTAVKQQALKLKDISPSNHVFCPYTPFPRLLCIRQE